MVYNIVMPPDNPTPNQPPSYQPDNFPPANQPSQPVVNQPYPQPQESPSPHPAAYDFIINPAPPSAHTKYLPGLPPANTLTIRVAYIAGGLLILLILFVIAKGIIVGKPKLDSFVSVAQDQQELIHLTSNTGSRSSSALQRLSTGNRNLAATIQVAITSNNAQTIKYLTSNHYKVSPKVLNLKVSSSLDTQLSNAQTAGTYNQVFQQILASELNTYSADLSSAYNSAGKKGKPLLSSEYKQAQLLLNVADSPTNSST